MLVPRFLVPSLYSCKFKHYIKAQDKGVALSSLQSSLVILQKGVTKRFLLGYCFQIKRLYPLCTNDLGVVVCVLGGGAGPRPVGL